MNCACTGVVGEAFFAVRIDSILGHKMEISKKGWPILSACTTQKRIDTQPDYQRPPVWSLSQKQMLIDTILRGYDVPKFYWRKVGSNPDRYEVVDGQQRLRAIWSFQANEFALPKKNDPVGDNEVAGLRYEELPDDLRLDFDSYNLDVVIISDTDEDEVREMFLRLQNGTTLKAQEKRNAMPGQMREFIRQLSQHPFFEKCGFANARFTFDLVAAQMTLVELKGGPTNVKNGDLNRMYEENTNFDASSPKARKIKRVLDFLLTAFPSKTPELERYSVVSLYALVSQVIERYVISDRQAEIARWFLDFETFRRSQRNVPVDQCDPEIISYHEKTSHSTDAEDSIRFRHDYLLRKLLEAVPDIEQKDDQRLFTKDQRLAIFRRDQRTCQVKLKCDGVVCEWDSWEADHRQPWSQGGKTTVDNGQVACLSCNSAKGARLMADAQNGDGIERV
jgi:Protein of unknown function DUF262/HNH endonuclease